ncbi:unnamed protein product [Callosobruchus maculatus]|uniref:Uncharacterized protein n=2 Tax=Callosobruchus maculatus TaxID=64391 RepID=A0A653CN71_CALMS|nr:unnamed protein product [Callosobruchus maculatus]
MLNFIIQCFPLQWLVKRSNEYRKEMAETVRQYAVSQFCKAFPLVQENMDAKKKILENIRRVTEAYRPHRYHKRKTAPPPDIESRVDLTLLEYEHRGGLRLIAPNNDEVDAELIQQQQDICQEKLQRLMASLVDVKEETSDLNNLSEEDKIKQAKHYASLHLELKDGGAFSKENSRLNSLNEQKQVLSEMVEKLRTTKETVIGNIQETNATLENIRLKKSEADKKLKELEEAELKDPEYVY